MIDEGKPGMGDLDEVQDNGDGSSNALEQTQVQQGHRREKHQLLLYFIATIPLPFNPKPYYDNVGKPAGAVITSVCRYIRPEPYFPFLDLPIELRIMVYEHLLVVGKVFYSPTGYEVRNGQRFRGHHRYRIPELQLLRTCKQVHAEAEPIYLSKNLFVLPKDWPAIDEMDFHLGHNPYDPNASKRRRLPPVFSTAAYTHVRSISITLDQKSMRDWMLSFDANYWNTVPGPDESFEDLTADQWISWVHVPLIEQSADVRSNISQELELFERLEYLETDFTNAFCLLGHCRLVEFPPPRLKDRYLTIDAIGLRTEEEEHSFTESVVWTEENGKSSFKYQLRFRNPGAGSMWDDWKMPRGSTGCRRRRRGWERSVHDLA